MPRKQLVLGVVGLLGLGALTAVALRWATTTATGCASLPTSAEGSVTPVVLVVELEGNTLDDAKDVQTFVTTELATITHDLTSQFSIRLAFVKNGEKSAIPGCLSQPRYIVPPKEDLATLEDASTSADTKKQLETSMAQYRRDRIAWIAQEAEDQVRQVSFAGLSESEPKLSPRFALNAAATYDEAGATVSVLSPFTSTVKDCFAASASDSVTQQVKDCLQYQQVAKLKASATSFVVEPSLLDPEMRDRAESVREALCELATTGGCRPQGTS
jgi:hypothetical protein